MTPRLVLAAAVLLLLVPLLSACGGQSYCDAVKAHQAELGSIAGSGRRTALLRALPIFEDLQSKAPGDVADDWQLVVTRIRALRTALDRAHVDPSSYDARNPPPGLSTQDRDRIREAAAGLAAPDTAQALANVQQEVLDVCHTPLEL
jgi:hypothetical protein